MEEKLLSCEEGSHASGRSQLGASTGSTTSAHGQKSEEGQTSSRQSKEKYLNGSTLALKFALPLLLFPSVFVLGGHLETNKDLIFVSSVMAVAQAALLVLVRDPISNRFVYIILMMLSFLVGFFSALCLESYAEYRLAKSYALIYVIVLPAIVLESHRISSSKQVLFPSGHWAGLFFQSGLLLYSFMIP